MLFLLFSSLTLKGARPICRGRRRRREFNFPSHFLFCLFFFFTMSFFFLHHRLSLSLLSLHETSTALTIFSTPPVFSQVQLFSNNSFFSLTCTNDLAFYPTYFVSLRFYHCSLIKKYIFIFIQIHKIILNEFLAIFSG